MKKLIEMKMKNKKLGSSKKNWNFPQKWEKQSVAKLKKTFQTELAFFASGVKKYDLIRQVADRRHGSSDFCEKHPIIDI